MQSALTNACTLKLEKLDFEGPFDLLFHLIEKDKLNIYDIPISLITDQYLDYLTAMRELNLEVASEFLVVAATLLHIKSRLLLPEKGKTSDEENAADPRDDLVIRLLEYRKYKESASYLREREEEWLKVYYKLPESDSAGGVFVRELSDAAVAAAAGNMGQETLPEIYRYLISKNKSKWNINTSNINRIIQREQISILGRMKELLKLLVKKGRLVFGEVFCHSKRSRGDIVSAFLAMLELSRLKRLSITQYKPFSDIFIEKAGNAVKTKGEGNT